MFPVQQATTTLGPIELWVDAATGSDQNDGTQARPFATLVQAEAVLPDIIAANVRINVAAGTYVAPVFRARVMRAQIYVYGTAFTELVAATAATAGSTTSVTCAGGLGVNTYRGKTIEILTGAAAGDRRTILAHTDTAITPCVHFTAAVGIGDTFKIVEPTAVIDLVDEAALTQGVHLDMGELTGTVGGSIPVPPALHFINFKLDNANGGSPIDVLVTSRVRFYGCELISADITRFYEGALSCGADRFEYAFAGVAFGFGSQAWWGWGLSAVGGVQLFGIKDAHLTGLVVNALVLFAGSEGLIMGGRTVGLTALRSGPKVSLVNITGKTSTGADIPFQIATSGVNVTGQGVMVLLLECSLDVGVNTAVAATNQAVVEISSDVVIVNCGIGAKALRGGVVLLSTVGFSFTNPPATDEFQAGQTPATGTLAGNFAAVGNFLVDAPGGLSDGSKVQRVA